jgi:hypothetical protein
VERAGEVHVDQPLPRLDRDVGERREIHRAGTGDQDVRRAEFAADLGERFFDRGAVGDIGCQPERLHP